MITIRFADGKVYVKTSTNDFREIYNSNFAKTLWEQKYTSGVPHERRDYTINAKIIDTWECKDADCEITGCKHSACYKSIINNV